MEWIRKYDHSGQIVQKLLTSSHRYHFFGSMTIDCSDKKFTPLMAQWASCKQKAKEALLLFRLGDFYESFYEDAEILARELDLILTRRQEVPMSGIPWHTVESYIDKLVEKGYKVAIAEQLEDPKIAKGLVKRDVVRIVTRGTLISSSLLTEKQNNFIAALCQLGKVYGLALLDLTTAEFKVTESEKEEELISELLSLSPKECLISSKAKEKLSCKLNESVIQVVREESFFDHKMAYQRLLEQFGLHNLDGFGLKGMVAAISAAGSLLSYLDEELSFPLIHLNKIAPYSLIHSLSIDSTTSRHLELADSSTDKGVQGTLLSVIDYTLTPMGGRLLTSWIKRPLYSTSKIRERQEVVSLLSSNPNLLNSLQTHLKAIRDLERLSMRVTLKIASPKDLLALRLSLEEITPIQSELSSYSPSLLTASMAKLHDMSEMIALLKKALVDVPPTRIGESDLFRFGYHAGLDEVSQLSTGGKEWLLNYQERLQEETGIKNLKINFNRVFGYFLEVSRGQAKSVPASFERKQTLANSERFTTPELQAFETKVLLAEERKSSLERELFLNLLEELSKQKSKLLDIAESIALIDALTSLSLVAFRKNYVCPIVDESQKLEIHAGRHPIVETLLPKDHFIPNDTSLDEKKRLFLITGPNMAGKSTYLRGVALLVILAHIGSFVPADFMHIGLIDKIFSRIGASDDLRRGHSTFMIEMSETANILNNATSRSLILLDEIGRGTSTYDGLAIAWSVAEFLLEKQSKTLFATHYFELTQLEHRSPAAVNYHATAKEIDGEIVFLYKIAKGKASQSYGIQVAKLAGLPLPVIIRAKEILHLLEEKKAKSDEVKKREEKEEQLHLFSM